MAATQSEPCRSMLGERINNFEIVRLLGEGGMGAVYEAEHVLIRRKVAIKVLKAELAVDADLVQRFFNEARATSAIRHLNIIEVVDVGTLADGVPYLVMELLEGESLADRIDRVGRLDVRAAVEVCCQAASALEAAHHEGIVHRDLKPGNLFLVPDQRFAERELVKVLDFGIAKLRSDLTASPVHTMAGAVFGTPPYMSPEQCRGVPSELDERTDIYALGIILYEALCGHPPFTAEGIGDMMMLHMNTLPVPPSQLCSGVPLSIERVILKALAKRRDDRFSSMAEFQAALVMAAESAALFVAIDAAESDELDAAAASLRASGQQAMFAEPLSITMLANAAAAAANASALHPAVVSKPRPRPRSAAFASIVLGALALLVVSIVAHQHAPLAPPHTHALAPLHVELALRARTPPPSAARSAAATTVFKPPFKPDHNKQPLLAQTTGRRPERHSNHTATTRPPDGAHSVAANPNTETTVSAAIAEHDSHASPAPEPGYLSLDSAPWSEVYLGGTLLGTTPIMHVALPPGKHVLTLKNSELGASTPYVVDIKSGTTTSRLVGWDKPR